MFQDHVTAIFIILYRLIYVETRLGIITFNKSNELREVFARLPLERLLVETDSPFLAPVPKRGRRNEPAFVLHTAERLAQLRDLPLEKLAQITSDNFYRLFRKASDKGRYDYK